MSLRDVWLGNEHLLTFLRLLLRPFSVAPFKGVVDVVFVKKVGTLQSMNLDNEMALRATAKVGGNPPPLTTFAAQTPLTDMKLLYILTARLPPLLWNSTHNYVCMSACSHCESLQVRTAVLLTSLHLLLHPFSVAPKIFAEYRSGAIIGHLCQAESYLQRGKQSETRGGENQESSTYPVQYPRKNEVSSKYLSNAYSMPRDAESEKSDTRLPQEVSNTGKKMCPSAPTAREGLRGHSSHHPGSPEDDS